MDPFYGPQGRRAILPEIRRCLAERTGSTAVYVEELTREAVYDALHARRCYATTGRGHPRCARHFHVAPCSTTSRTEQRPATSHNPFNVWTLKPPRSPHDLRRFLLELFQGFQSA